MPPVQASDHPCYDVAKGERLLKDVYEALRAGPGWGRPMAHALILLLFYYGKMLPSNHSK